MEKSLYTVILIRRWVKSWQSKVKCHPLTTGTEEDREDVVEMEMPSASMMDKIRNEISELQDILLNHKLVKHSFQQASHIVQVSSWFYFLGDFC